MIRLLFSLIFLTSCSPTLFTAYTRYHTQRDLASYYAKTPDPRLNSVDYLGQSLYFEWTIPKNLLKEGPVWIEFYVRLKNLDEKFFSIPITSVSGHTSWNLMGYDWYNSGGIFTFKASLLSNGFVIKEVEHPLFTNLIQPH